MKTPLLSLAIPVDVLAVASSPRFYAARPHPAEPHAPKTATAAETGDAAVVDAADAFAAPLTDAQKTQFQTLMDKTSVARWSNLPVSLGSRNGVPLSR